MIVTYRRAAPDDLGSIYNIEMACFSHPWSKNSLQGEICDNPLALYVLAEADGSPAGYCGMHTIFDEGHILNVAVLPQYRRQGIGEGLVSALFEAGLKYYTLEVRVTNHSAISLYKRMGFKTVGKRAKYYGDEDALIMWKGKNAP